MHKLPALLAQPALLADLSPADAAAALVELSALQSALAARLGSVSAPVRSEVRIGGVRDQLCVDEAARRLGVTRRWLYRHAKQLPFARRLSRKVLRFDEPGLEAWLRKQRP